MSKTIIIYYAASMIVQEGQDGLTLAELKTGRAELASKFGGNVLLRDAAHFNAVEVFPDDNPLERVLLIGPDDEVGAIGEAYEAVGVQVDHGQSHFSEEEGSTEGAKEPAVKGDDPLAELKARATELGIHFASNIGEATLKGRIEQEEAALAKADKEARNKAEAAAAAAGGAG